MAQDKDDVLAVHRLWHSSHRDWFEKREEARKQLRRIFPGEHLHMFNLDGNVYRGAESIVAYWEGLSNVMEILERPTDQDLTIHVDGNTAILTCRFNVKARFAGGPAMEMPVRGTEMYRRDDGNGKPEWRMWHCHYSSPPPPGPPPGGVAGPPAGAPPR